MSREESIYAAAYWRARAHLQDRGVALHYGMPFWIGRREYSLPKGQS